MIQLSNKCSCTIIFGLAEVDGDKIDNTPVVISKGRYIGKYRKMHHSDFEKRLFEEGDENYIFDVDGIRIGVQICFDLWFPEISREQFLMGADLFSSSQTSAEKTHFTSQRREQLKISLSLSYETV